MLILYFCIFLLNCGFTFCDSCCRIGREFPKYVLVKNNAKSLKSIIARRELPSLEKCQEFAETKKALAFNFGREESERYFRYDLYNANCVVLDCPEIYNFTDLQNAIGVKYYSLYPYWIWANDNSTNGSLSCIPGVGLFLYFEETLNFLDARLACKKINATLANVVSEERTEGFKSIISNTTFVGLSSQSEKRTWKNEFDEPLECFDYRAWGEKEPSHSRGCVALFRPNLKEPPHWKVLPCHLKNPFICEIPPANNTKPKSRKRSHGQNL